MQTIKISNGDTLQFPDEMSDEQIQSAIHKEYGYPKDSGQGLENKPKKRLLDRAADATEKYINQPVGDAALGFAQGIANVAPGIANLAIHARNGLTGSDIEPYKGFSFAPDTTAAKVGEIGSYFAGTPLLKGAARLGGLLENPAVRGSLAKATELFSRAPRLSGLAGVAGSGALQGAIYNPENQTVGGLLGTAGNIVGAAGKFIHPYLAPVSRAALGASAGYAVDRDWKGALAGAGLGLAAPSFARSVGLSKEPVSYDFLKDIPFSDVEERVAANKRIGTRADIGEVSGNPFVGSRIGDLSNTAKGAQAMTKAALEKIEEQSAAINRFKSSISANDKVADADIRKAANLSIDKMKKIRADAVEDLYEKSYTNSVGQPKKISPNLVKSLSNSDATIKNAIRDALSDDAYSVELKGYPRNSIKVLDYAKRKIDSEIEKAKNFNDNDRVRVLTASKERLTNALDGFSKEYATARSTYEKLSVPIAKAEESHLGRLANISDINLKNISKTIFDPNQTDINVLKNLKQKIMAEDPKAWDNIVRNEITRLTKGQKSAADFHKNVLSNENLFAQFQEALSHNSEALSKLTDMKKGWEFMTKPNIGKNNRFLAEKNLDKARSSTADWINWIRSKFGDRQQKAKIEFLNDPNWERKYDEVVQYKSEKARKEALANLISESIIKGTIKFIPAAYTASQNRVNGLAGER